MATDKLVNLSGPMKVPPTADANAIREALPRQRRTGSKFSGFGIAIVAIARLYLIFYKTGRVPGWKILDTESKSMQVR